MDELDVRSLDSFLGTDGSEGSQGFSDVLLDSDLGGEDVPHYTLLVYDVGDPTWEETEGVGNIVEPPDLTPLVAE